jgi:dolichyl-phosphate beta-glucosyltransferase
VLSTLIVVPCYNEATRLEPGAFARFLAAESNIRFLFVDDGSTDTTAGVLLEMHRQWPERISLLHLERNQGKAEAVRRGVLDAARFGGTLIGYWDADLATPLTEIPIMAAYFVDPDLRLVVGSRVRMLGRRIQRSPLRHVVGRAFATLASIALRLPVYDTQCGAKLFRASPAIVGLFSRPFRLQWCFDVELLARFASLPAAPSRCRTCIEHPVSQWADVGASRLTARQALRIFPELMRLPSIVAGERRRQTRIPNEGGASSR